MGILSDLMGKARGYFAARAEAPPPPSETRAIESTSFDRDAWQQVLDGSASWQREAMQMSRTVDNAADLLGDLHSALYKVQPRLRDADEMAETHAANHQVMSTLVGSQELQHLRLYTRGDAYAAAVGMQALQEQMMTALDHVREATAEAEQRKAEAEQRAQEAAERLQQALDAAANAGPSPIEQQVAQDNLAAAMQQAQQEDDAAGAAAGTLQQEAQAAAQGEAGAMRRAAQQAVDQLDEEAALMAAYGVEPGDLMFMTPEERMALAERLRNDRLAEFAKLIGAFRAVQKAQSRKRVVNAVDQVYGIELSDSIPRMIGSEYSNFAHPVLEAQMLIRYTEHRLLTAKTRGRQKAGQGPIICIVDESGSMNANDVAGGATREAWSKGFALALLDQARRRGRDFIYIGFSAPSQQHVIEFPKGETTLDKVLTMTGHFFKGGTSFQEPLETALGIVEQYANAGKARPDLVMVTDAMAGPLPEGFLHRYWEVKRRASITTYGIAIGCSSRGALHEVSDDVREITELVSDPSAVGDIFTTI